MASEMNFTLEQIRAGLRIDIADCLALEPDDVDADAAFFTALQGESIELLDLSFRIQKRFGIRTRFQDLMQGLEFDPDGKISASSVRHLNADFPDINWDQYVSALTIGDPRSLLTVRLIEELVYYSQTTNDVKGNANSSESSMPTVLTSQT